MGMLIFFAAGYVVGSRGGDESLDEVVKAVRAIRRSEEFDGLVRAVRAHAADTLRGLAGTIDRLGGDADNRDAPSDLLDRVRLLASRR
jgi:hypothetical protein